MKSLVADEFTPRRQTTDSAGYDFYAPCDFTLRKGEWTEIDTQVVFDGTEFILFNKRYYGNSWFMLLLPRSGLGFKYGMRLANTAGVVDAGYRQTIKVKMTIDIGDELIIHKGERFMQGIFFMFGKDMGESTPEKERDGGFGSTGQ